MTHRPAEDSGTTGDSEATSAWGRVPTQHLPVTPSTPAATAQPGPPAQAGSFAPTSSPVADHSAAPPPSPSPYAAAGSAPWAVGAGVGGPSPSPYGPSPYEPSPYGPSPYGSSGNGPGAYGLRGPSRPSTPALPTSLLPAPPSQSAAASGSAVGSGRTRLVALVAAVGLVSGLLGGIGVLAVNRLLTPAQTSSGLPAPVPGTTARPDGSIAQIAARALPSVVTVKIKTADGSGNGSGFVIDRNGHVLTNSHVVDEATKIVVETHDGRDFDATVVGRDGSYDLAVLQLSTRELPPLEFGRSADVVVGDGVVAVGAPLGLDSTVTSGIVSALGRPVAAGGGDVTSYINAIQTDAAINPGNSGGPLLDMNGRVIGITSAIARDPGSSSSVGGSIGVGFAIPSDQAVKTANQLISTGKATHPIIGINLDRSFTGEGARVADGGIAAGSAAQKAGLRPGDVIVALDGKRMSTVNQLVVSVRARDVGDTVRLTIDRGGQQLEVTLQLQGST